MNGFRFLSLAGWLCVAAAALGAAAGYASSPASSPAEEPGRAGEQADRSLTVAARKGAARKGEVEAPGAALAQARQPVPLWDRKESVAQYARRVNLPETKTLDLGNGVTLELVLIPAGKFIMGTPGPAPVDKAMFCQKIIVGQGLLAAAAGILLVFISVIITRAIRDKHRPQYSLARFIAMMLALSVGVMGGMHWWHSGRALALAQAEYREALAHWQKWDNDEDPAHAVTLTRPFYLGKFQVTQAQYKQVLGTDPSHNKGANFPVEMISWDDAQEFCKKASQQSGQSVRLPTEAEWEFACRAGTKTDYCTRDTEFEFYIAAWPKTGPVGQYAPNAWGLYDMHGNVLEWCQDRYEHYKAGPVVDPQGPAQGNERVQRLGFWHYNPGPTGRQTRSGHAPDYRGGISGVRVVVPGRP